MTQTGEVRRPWKRSPPGREENRSRHLKHWIGVSRVPGQILAGLLSYLSIGLFHLAHDHVK